MDIFDSMLSQLWKYKISPTAVYTLFSFILLWLRFVSLPSRWNPKEHAMQSLGAFLW